MFLLIFIVFHFRVGSPCHWLRVFVLASTFEFSILVPSRPLARCAAARFGHHDHCLGRTYVACSAMCAPCRISAECTGVMGALQCGQVGAASRSTT
eukprot:2691484-Rhodomonas_salina.3